MKIVILYRPESEHGRHVEEFVREFKRREASRQVELISLESKEGAQKARLYDVVQYPAILALRDDGGLLQFWQGEPLPLLNEVAAYANN